MANWYYYNESGEKIEVTGGQLKGLAKAGRITPDTIVETEDGKKARAGKVKGLTFTALAESSSKSTITPPDSEEVYGLSAPPVPSPTTTPISKTADTPIADIPEAEETVIAPPVAAQPVPMPQVAPPTANVYCTNCGNPIAENAVACMSCGARPIGHKKFCRHCGVALNPEQIVCVKCGSGLTAPTAAKSVQDGIANSVTSIKQVAGNMFARTVASVKKLPIATSTATTPLANPSSTAMPQANHAMPQSATAPVVAERKSSLMVTLIGIVVVFAVSGIGWVIISTSSPSSRPSFTAEEQKEIDEFLALHGNDVKAVNPEIGYTLLHKALMPPTNGNIAIIKYLISQGADINAESLVGTPLHLVLTTMDMDIPENMIIGIVKILVSNGADVNTTNTLGGNTSLHLAIKAENADIEIVRFLVSNDADVNATDMLGNTPLHLAIKAENADIEIVRFLVSNGADVNATDMLGNTPLDIAKRRSHNGIVEYLSGLK